jgi:predicted RNA-binding protein
MLKVSEGRIAWDILGPERERGSEGRMEKITRI